MSDLLKYSHSNIRCLFGLDTSWSPEIFSNSALISWKIFQSSILISESGPETFEGVDRVLRHPRVSQGGSDGRSATKCDEM